MATSFRYGHGGSYKSACAVWFDLLPALRQGRVCITNVHGMQPLSVIEKRLGEKFPDSTRLIRISSRNSEGFDLWKYFFCWCPIGSFILIDECQQIFSTNAGFKMANIHKRPFSDFEPLLPEGFKEIFDSRWLTVNKEDLSDAEVDDCNRTRFDEQGRIIYPENFNNAFMEHRHYNWDIVLLTPDFAQVPKELKGVAELAKQHKAKDGVFFSKRRPRVLEHDPLRTVTSPNKDDVIYSLKVPLDVHLLYASTVTGQITKAGLGKNVFLAPKFLAAMLILLLSGGYFIYGVIGFFSDSEATPEAVTQVSDPSVANDVPHSSVDDSGQKSAQGDSSLGDGSNSRSTGDSSNRPYHNIGVVPSWFPVVNLEGFYITAVERHKTKTRLDLKLHFQAISRNGISYLDDKFLKHLGVTIKYFDDCLVSLSRGDSSFFVTCPPEQTAIASNESQSPVKLEPLGSVF